MPPIALRLTAFLVVVSFPTTVVSADELRLAGVFGSNMVLQHGTPIVSDTSHSVRHNTPSVNRCYRHTVGWLSLPALSTRRRWYDCRLCGDGLLLRLR
eukprot:COSAG06_NODE_1992_length_7894_cov_7.031174_4_plen_98_part_00